MAHWSNGSEGADELAFLDTLAGAIGEAVCAAEDIYPTADARVFLTKLREAGYDVVKVEVPA